MKPPPRLRVHPHREGPWLVVHGHRRLAVPPELGRRLSDLDGGRPGATELAARLGGDEAAARALLQAAARRQRGRGPWLRLPLVPARRIGRWVRPLVPLTGGRALALLSLGGGWLVAAAGPQPGGLLTATGDWLLAVGLFLVGGLVHELGHAAALARSGYPPGGIGAGLLLVLPVLYCDVSAVGLLGRADKARVDLAGPVFQIAVAGLLATAARALPPPAAAACGAAALWSVLAAAWSLTPLFRADGFWLLTDLLGLDDLDRLPRAGDGRRATALRVGYRLVHGAVFAFMGANLLRDGSLADRRGIVAAALGGALLLMVALRLLRLALALRRESS